MSQVILGIGSTPCNEESLARKECAIYMAQLLRHYEKEQGKKLPDDCTLVVRSNDLESYNDFGSYYVAVKFNPFSDESLEAANWLESNLPANWDDTAKLEIAAIGSHLITV